MAKLDKLQFRPGQTVYAVPVGEKVEDVKELDFFATLDEAMDAFDISWTIYEMNTYSVIKVERP